MPNYTGHCAPDLQALTVAHSMIFIFLVTYHCVYIYLVAMTLKKTKDGWIWGHRAEDVKIFTQNHEEEQD